MSKTPKHTNRARQELARDPDSERGGSDAAPTGLLPVVGSVSVGRPTDMANDKDAILGEALHELYQRKLRPSR